MNLTEFILNLSPLFSAIAHGIIFFIITKLLLLSYSQHEYLYNFKDKKKTLATWTTLFLPLSQKFQYSKYRNWVELSLTRSGWRSDFTVDHFIARQIFFFVLSFIFGYFLLALILGAPLILTIIISILALFLPTIKLKDIATNRLMRCNKDLPYFVDYLALSLDAGLDFTGGLTIVEKDASQSPLKDEFSLMLKNIHLGVSREGALNKMLTRLQTPSLRLFVQNLVQSMKTGSETVQTLNSLSETLRTNRFQSAEEKAGKISVKMMIPMMVFVFPATAIILLGPLLIEGASLSF